MIRSAWPRCRSAGPQLADLRRRYTGDARSTLADLFAVRDELSGRLAELDSHAERAAAAEAARAEARRRPWPRRPPSVGQQRREPRAGALAAAVQERLAELALRQGPGRASRWATTIPGDDVSFLLALNPGCPRRPLAKAASGGELARTMLALRLDRRGAGAHPRVRRGRRRRRRRARPARSAGRWPALAERQAGAGGHPPAAGGGLRRRAGRAHQARRRRHHGDAGRGARRRGRGCASWPGCCRASPTATRARTTPRSSSPPRPRSGVDDGAADGRRARAGGGVVGRARVGKRTKDLTKRLEPGDIAVIDHADLDRVAADGLIDAGVVAVVNASPSITGRYPNGGPLRLVRAGVRAGRRRRLARSWTPSPTGSRSASTAGRCWPATRSSAPVTCSARTRSSAGWRRRGPASATSSSASPRTPSSTCSARPTSCSRRSCCRSCGPPSPAGTPSSWCAATTTSRTCGCCARTSASSSRC